MAGSEATTRVGRYELRAPLGRGGAATVWRAWDPELEVERALKLLDARPGAGDAERSARLKREARAMAALGHAHVLRVLDIGEHEGRPFVVSELAPGGSLADRVEEDGPLPVPEVGRLLAQVLSAVAAAHDAGIIHRDIKPQNVLLNAKDDALLADFGIARLADDTADRSTKTGMALGSLAYMAPEQRLDAHRVGARADVYAVGATAYHLLTGLSPMDLFVAGEDDPRWAGVPPALRSVLVRATRYAPEERFPDAPSLAAALATAVAAGGVVQLPAADEESVPRAPLIAPTVAAAVAPPRRPVGLVLGGLALLFGVGAGAWTLLRPSDDAPARDAAVDAVAPPEAVVVPVPEPAPQPEPQPQPQPEPQPQPQPEPEPGPQPEAEAEPEPEAAAAEPTPAPPPIAAAPRPKPAKAAAPAEAAAAMLGTWEGQTDSAYVRWRVARGAGPGVVKVGVAVAVRDGFAPETVYAAEADGDAVRFEERTRGYTLTRNGKDLRVAWRERDTSSGSFVLHPVSP